MMKKNRFLPFLAMLVAVPMALTACSNGAASKPTGATGGGDAGTLNIGINVEPTDWAPSRIQTIMFPFTRQVYDSLINYDDKLTPSPSLATKWVVNNDQSAVTITLRDDVVFHSGRKMTAADVAANLKFFANPDTGQQLFGPMSVVDSWKAVDDTTLDVTFKQPISERQITDLLQSWTIGDPKFFHDSSRGEGTGPYKFVKWLHGVRIDLKRNDDYWGEAPKYDEVFYRVFGDMASLIAGFESGVIDVAVDVPALDAKRLAAANTVLVGKQGALIDQWRINPTVAPFDNANVRKAINYATDRKTIVEAMYRGFSAPTALPYSPDSPAYDKDLAASLAYDLDHGRELIKSSGLSGDQLSGTITVTSANERTSQAAQILQASLAKIGFTLKIEVRDNAEYTKKMLAGEFGITFAGIGNAQKYPTRITTNSIYRIADNPVKALEVFPDYGPAVAAANSAMTEEEQAKAFKHLNEVLVEAMWVVSVGYQPTLWLISPHVTGVDRNVDNMLLLRGAAPAS